MESMFAAKLHTKVFYGSAVVTFVCSFAANNLNTLNIYNFFIVKYYSDRLGRDIR